MTYGDLEDGLVDRASKARDDISPNHVTHGLHIGLPDGSAEHDQGGGEVDRSPAHSEGKGDEDDTAHRQGGHVGGIPIVEDGIAHPKLDIEVLPERDGDAKTAGDQLPEETGAARRGTHMAKTINA